MQNWLRTILVGIQCLVPAVAAAQQLRGSVRDSASASPVAGAVISGLDSLGKLATRTIADGAGRFAISTASRVARLRVIRIGYQPRDVAVPQTPGDAPLAIAMMRLPSVLETVRVSDRELCPGSTDRGAAFELWEQARAGLLAAVVAREAKPAMATTLLFERSFDENNHLIRRQTIQARRGRTSRPFLSSASAATFARRGYMAEDATGARTYSAPDADVLLDESFVATHCFHLQATDAVHEGQMGLAFTPVHERDSIVDVNGVIWIDRATPALRTLEFHYTGLEPAAARSGIGGHIEFRTMPNGVAFIEYWTLRLPVLAQSRPMSPAMPGASVPQGSTRATRRQDRVDFRVAEIVEAGGQVLDAKWDDDTHWEEPRTGLTGTVTQSGSSAPVPYALVTLRGTNESVTANANGEYTIVPLVAGKYTVVVSDTTLNAFAAERRASSVVDIARGQVASMRVELAPLAGVIADLCKGQPSSSRGTTIVGRVVRSDGDGPQGAEVYATWQELVQAGSQYSVRNAQRSSTVDDRGRFILCGAPAERSVHLRLVLGKTSADTTVSTAATPLSAVDWRVRLEVQTVATLSGTVIHALSQSPLAGAEVSIPSIARLATTGPDGSFRLETIPAGSYEVQVRHLGDELFRDSITLSPQTELRRTFALRPAVVLDTVRATAQEERRFLSSNLIGFEERRANGGGSFIDDTVLRANEGQYLGDLLRTRTRGMRVQSVRGAMYAASSRDQRSGKFAVLDASGSAACFSTFYIDGILIYDKETSAPNALPPNLNDYSVKEIGGIEYYPSGGSSPPRFKMGPCGLLLLWKREK